MLELTLLISTVATAMVYVLSAYGLVVTYRVAGVFNLALGYQAAMAAYLYWQLSVSWGWNVILSAVIVVIVAGPLLGFVLQQVLFRKRREILTSIIVTLGLGVLIEGLIQVFWGGTSESRVASSVFGEKYWNIGSASLTANELGVIVSAIVIGAMVWFLLNRSRTGLHMRAVVDDPELAGATAIRYGRISAIAWMVASTLAAVSGILLAPLLNLDVVLLTGLVVNAFAVAAFAGMTSLPLVVIGALVLSYLQALVERYADSLGFLGSGGQQVVPFVMLAIVLLVHPAAQRSVRVVGGGMQRRLRERASGNVSFAVLLTIVLTVVALMLSGSWAFTGAQVACFSIAALSLVLLVGASGQISLGQVTFMGLSTIMVAKLTEQGVPWGVAMVGGVLTAAIGGVLIALTAFRLRGLFLALLTYGFAYAAMVLVFRNPEIISFAGLSIDRPTIFGLDLNDDSNMLIACAAALLLSIGLIGVLLKGPWGRALQTLSAGDSVADVSGLPVRQWKLIVFTVSAALAGFGGGMLGTVNMTVTGDSFLPAQSIFLLVYAVVGGVTTATGAVLAGVIAQAGDDILDLVVSNPGAWALVLFGVMAIDTSIRYPAGFGGMLPQSIPGMNALASRTWARRRRNGPPDPSGGAVPATSEGEVR